ncbi:tyrosyl-DNA phosphodiesterase-domain-containing protein [Obelidium mucronatum]|nr:tyrosyl-DNA phosphodiesterase-domain-containing protein [Obelidium mucronatum]
MTWTCHICTFINSKPLGLSCEVCESERAAPAADLPSSVGKTRTTTTDTEPQQDLTRNDKPALVDSDDTKPSIPSRAQLEKERLLLRPNPAASKKRHLSPPNPSPKQSSNIFLTQIAPYPSTSKTTTFAQIVQRPTKAFLSAFQFDLSWIASHLPPNIPVCLALHNPTASPPKIQKNICIVFPKLATTQGAYSTMHIKLCVLYHVSSVRVVVSSANLVDYDWDSLENVVWVQDFPLKQGKGNVLGGGSGGDMDDGNENPIGLEFKSDLVQLLKDMEAQEWVWEGLASYDFSKCTARLVISKPGKFVDDDAFRYGIGRLSSVVHEGFGRMEENKETSSLGSLSTAWLTDFESAARGSLFAPASSKTASKNTSPAEPTINILFPTRETVQSSFLGQNGAGTITWNHRMWEQCQYKHLLKDSESKRKGALSHCKIILSQTLEEKKPLWYYCGSHNMTMSAWGRASVVGKVKKEKQLYITNWELGVILVSPDLSAKTSTEWTVPFVLDPLKSHGSGIRASHTS